MSEDRIPHPYADAGRPRPRHAAPPLVDLFGRLGWLLGWAYLFSPIVLIVLLLIVAF